MGRSWGKIMFGVRLEKQVQDTFFTVWTDLLASGMRPGDRYSISHGKVAHRAANALVQQLLQSDCDTLAFIDSDADIDAQFFERMRSFEPGQEYDVLQAFYVRRGWPPDAIWFQEDAAGNLQKCYVLNEATEDVAIVGLHCCLVRREVFERMVGAANRETFDWFYYPQNTLETEDAAFSFAARKLGFRLGATTAVKAGHISSVTLGWDTYQEFLRASGMMEAIDNYNTLLDMLIDYTGMPEDHILARAAQGSKNVDLAWITAGPQDGASARAFYGKADGYLFDLFNWNASKPYVHITRGLRDLSGYRALVIGGGLGTEAAMLARTFENVFIFELPGVLRSFLKWRFALPDPSNARVCMLEDFDRLEDVRLAPVDLITAIDVIEHVHPDELNGFLDAIDRMLIAGGVLYAHVNFGQQDIYPMHYDHSADFAAWLQAHGYTQDGLLIYRKPGAL